MPEITVEGLSKTFGRDGGADRRQLQRPRQGVPDPAGPQRVRQDDDADVDRRLSSVPTRAGSPAASGPSSTAPEGLPGGGGPEPRDGLPVLRDLAAPDGVRQRRVPAQDPADTRKDALRRRVMETLELVEMADYAGRYPHELSGGQQQRVALARALVYSPSVLLLDEPFSNLDAKLRERARTWLRRLQGELGLTTLFVTHDQDEALSLSDRIVVMNGGRGPPGRHPRGDLPRTRQPVRRRVPRPLQHPESARSPASPRRRVPAERPARERQGDHRRGRRDLAAGDEVQLAVRPEAIKSRRSTATRRRGEHLPRRAAHRLVPR